MPSSWGAVIDPTADNPANSPLNIADGVTYRIKSVDLPRAQKKTVYAGSFDTEGSEPADDHGCDNRVMTLELWVQGSSNATAEAAVNALIAKEGKLNTLQKGTIGLTFPSGEVHYYDVVEAEGAETWDWYATQRYTILVTLKYTCKPFARGVEVGNLADDFSVDTIGAGLWAFDVGSGTASVASGQLVPSTTAGKRLYRTDRQFYDCEITAKITTGATVTNMRFGAFFKRLDATNYLQARIGGDNLLVVSAINGGSPATVQSAAFTPSALTSYWVRMRMEGNLIYLAVFSAAPTPGSTPLASTSIALTSGNATKFGRGVKGSMGLTITPHGTDERYDDFSVAPEVKTSLAAGTEPVYGIGGDVRALARWVVDELSGADQFWGVWGLQDDADMAATAALFYEAEGRLKLGGATTTTTTGASGGGSNNTATQATLTPAWQALLSTDQSGGGSPLTHVGEFRVFARIQMPTTNAGEVSIRFDYAVGDYTLVTRNDEDGVAFDANHSREGQWVIVDLGLIDIKRIQSGTHRWEGRLVAKSTVVGDDLIVDYLAFVPIDLYAELRAQMQFDAPTSFAARDEFGQTAGALTGKTLPVGGTWAGAGDASPDAQVSGSGSVTRSAMDDADTLTGRYLIAGTATYTESAAQVDVQHTAPDGSGVAKMGVLVRYADPNNWLMAYVSATDGATVVTVQKRVAGFVSFLSDASLYDGNPSNTAKSLRLYVSANGRWAAWCWPAGGAPSSQPLLRGMDVALATGGSLASGKVGFYDVGAPSD